MTSNTDAASDGSEERRYVGRLVRGMIYTLRDRRIEPGFEYIFTEADMLHLSEHAVETRENPGFDPNYDDDAERSVVVDYFEFRPYVEGEILEIHDDERTSHPGRDNANSERRARVVAEIRAGTRSKVQRRERGTESPR